MVITAPGETEAQCLLVCSASASHGLGHLYRCRALNTALNAIGGITSQVWVLDKQWDAGYDEYQPAFSSVASLRAFLARTTAVSLVVDVHESEAHQISELANTGLPMVVIDDMGHVPKAANLSAILSAQAYADGIDYSSTGCSTIFRGPGYFLTPRGIVPRLRANTGSRPTLLLTFGGGRTHGVEHAILNALVATNSIVDWSVELVVGSAYPDSLADLRLRFPSVKVRQNVENMATVINNADAAFSAAGDTVYELISAGVPTAAVAIANNQIPAMEHLAAHGAIVGLGSYPDPGIGDDVILDAWRGLTGATTREHLSDTGMRLVDGQGTPRIARLIAELVSGKA